MEFLITPGINPTQFFIWVRDRALLNRVADYVETHGPVEVTQTTTRGRWVNPNMQDAGCIVAWYHGNASIPQHMYNETLWATRRAFKHICHGE